MAATYHIESAPSKEGYQLASCNPFDFLDIMESNATKESLDIFNKWSKYHCLSGHQPITAIITLGCKNGKSICFPTFDRADILKYMKCLENIHTCDNMPFLIGPYMLNTTYKKANPSQGEYFYNITMFACGTVTGTLSYDSKGTLYLIYIENNSPGNGDFGKMIDAIEGHAATRKLNIAVMDFENKKLKSYFTGRGYVPFTMPGVSGVIKRYQN